MDRLGEIHHGPAILDDGGAQDAPRLFLHRTLVVSRTHPQALLGAVVQIADGEARRAINDCTDGIDVNRPGPSQG